MDNSGWLAERFEENRPHLQAVAYRMLGSLSEAEDAVQEAWLRFSRSDTSSVENLTGWLTTVVARLCLASHACASTCCARASLGVRSSSTCICLTPS